jgi:hypothetical protein
MVNFKFINNLNYFQIEGVIWDLKHSNRALWTADFTPPTEEYK